MKNFWNWIFGKETPSQELIHECRMIVEYKFIPSLVSGIPGRLVTAIDLMMIDTWPEFMKKKYGRFFYFDWDDMSCKEIFVDDSHIIILYTFPWPSQMPEAAYGAILMNTSNKKAMYYTLELSFDNEWILGQADIDGHYNFGMPLSKPTLENFIEWVSMHAPAL